jgi:hypothetical protein
MRFVPAIFLSLCCTAVAFAQTSAAMCQISGRVTDPNAHPLAGGIVKIYNQNALTQIVVGIGTNENDLGQYRSPLIVCGAKYTLRVERDGYATYFRQDLFLTGKVTADVELYPQYFFLQWFEPLVAGLLAGLFFFSVIVVRWNNIALLDQSQLRAEVAATRTSLLLETDKAKSEETKELNKELDEAIKAFSLPRRFKLFDILFWTRGDEIAAWTRVREVQRQLINLWPSDVTERLRARLQVAEQTLRADASPSAQALAALIAQSLASESPAQDRWKQLLLEALNFIYTKREEDFGALTIWQSKAAWLALIACTFIVATVAAQGGGMLFLAGAVGGYMSRLARALQAKDIPTDYGASWNTLFLSPLLGALAGFFGVLLLQGLGSSGLLQGLGLADTGAKPNLAQASTLTLAALAFILGFSERLFNSLIDAVDKPPSTAGAGAAAMVSVAPPPPRPATSVRDISPSPAKPGESITVTGTGLEPAKVDGVELRDQGNSQIALPAGTTTQAPEQIRFQLPPTLANGKYMVMIKVRDAKYIPWPLEVKVTSPP